MQAVEQVRFLSGVVRDVTAQFGLNSNPTVFTITVVKEGGGTLSVKPRQPVTFSLGALAVNGYVQSWDEQKVNIAGTGVYSVRVTDARPALECVHVLLQAPTNGNPGRNVVAVRPELVDDLEMGVLYSDVVDRIEDESFRYGSNTFKVRIGFSIQNRSIDHVAIPYRIRGTAMSLVELLNQVADENGFEWYAEGTDPVNIRAITRRSSAVNMEGLAAQHGREIIRLSTGAEARDEVARTILYGANKQSLIYSPGSDWKPYYGLNRDGTDVNTQLTVEYNTKTLKASMEDIDKILNNETPSSAITEGMLPRVEDAINRYVGRQFYKVVSAQAADESHESWLDVCSAGWWSGTDFPDDLPEDAKVAFGTDDGRWVSFAKLIPSGPDNGVYAEDVQRSPDVYIPAQGKGYTRVSIERVDLSDAKGNRTKSVWVVTVPFNLTATKKKTVVEDGKAVQKDRTVRILGLDKLWLTMLDHRQAYGPWTSDQLNSQGNKARVLFDSSITPWTFGYRGISQKEANERMNRVAGARLSTSTCRLEAIDTGELEVAGLPRKNLGAEIGTGTNITNINVNYDVRGIRTLYKCNVYTNELGRYQRYYQDLIDKLRRDADRQMRQQDHEALRRELQALKKDVGTGRNGKDGKAADTTERMAVVRSVGGVISDKRYPSYICTLQREIKMMLADEDDPPVYESTMEDVEVLNLAETRYGPARLPIGTLVRVTPYDTITITDRQTGQPKTLIYHWAMSVSAPAPKSSPFLIAAAYSNTSGPPTYRLSPITRATLTIEGPLTGDDLVKLQDVGSLLSNVEGLLPAEVDKLDCVLNMAEPLHGPGNLPKNTTVQVNWQLGADGYYYPNFSQSLNIFVSPKTTI